MNFKVLFTLNKVCVPDTNAFPKEKKRHHLEATIYFKTTSTAKVDKKI